MSRPTKQPVFLHRATYRQRRVRDAAKLLPFLGLVLWAIPLTWASDAREAPIGASGVVYVFGVWLILIVLTAVFASKVRVSTQDEGDSDR